MAKKIKFPLEMKDGVKVRNLDELKENFNLEKIVSYFLDGRLLNWLNDRYYETESQKISDIDLNSVDLKKELCEIFEVEFTQNDLNIEELEYRNNRLKKLKEYTDDEEIINNLDNVAFNQEELADLLDEGVTKIYLCNNKFDIPLSKGDISYIGVKDAMIEMRSKEVIDFKSKKIFFQNIKFNEEYTKLIQKNEELEKRIKYKPSLIGYSLINNNNAFKQSEQLFSIMNEELKDVKFDLDIYTKPLVKILKDSQLESIFDKFLSK